MDLYACLDLELGLRTRACKLYCYRDLKWCVRYLYLTLMRGTDCPKIKCYNITIGQSYFSFFQKIAQRMHFCLCKHCNGMSVECSTGIWFRVLTGCWLNIICTYIKCSIYLYLPCMTVQKYVYTFQYIQYYVRCCNWSGASSSISNMPSIQHSNNFCKKYTDNK